MPTTAVSPAARSLRSPGTRRGPRMTADERRDAIVAAATEEFATGGLVGASVDAIARRVGVSQPYVFQLFGTKKDLFLATVASCFERIVLAFEDSVGKWARGEDADQCNSALHAMGHAYYGLLEDRTLLMLQLQSYAACSDPDVRDVVRDGWRRLYTRVTEISGASKDELHQFFANGMLLNLGAALGMPGKASDWDLQLFEEGV